MNWNTKKLKSLFPLKGKDIYSTCKVYHGLYSCKENYIGESKCNMETRWREHNNPTHDSEPEKPLNKNIQRRYNWMILTNASTHTRKKNKLEVIY